MDMPKCMDAGMDAGEIIYLLNEMGFKKVTMISADTDYLDFAWQLLEKKELLEQIGNAMKEKHPCKTDLKDLHATLSREDVNNQLVIDYEFDKYMKTFLRQEKPLIFSFNWTVFFKQPKSGANGEADPIHGECEEHAVVACGCNKRSIHILDSHHQYYKGKLKRYKNGRYSMTWRQMMNVIGAGDVYLPSNYDSSIPESRIEGL